MDYLGIFVGSCLFGCAIGLWVANYRIAAMRKEFLEKYGSKPDTLGLLKQWKYEGYSTGEMDESGNEIWICEPFDGKYYTSDFVLMNGFRRVKIYRDTDDLPIINKGFR